MQSKTEALRVLKEFLEEHGLRYMVIGGLANAVWGRPRTTYGADLKVLPGEQSVTELAELVGTRFEFRRPDAIAFAGRSYVLLLQVTDRVPVDLGIGFLPLRETSYRTGSEG